TGDDAAYLARRIADDDAAGTARLHEAHGEPDGVCFADAHRLALGQAREGLVHEGRRLATSLDAAGQVYAHEGVAAVDALLHAFDVLSTAVGTDHRRTCSLEKRG